MASQDIKTISFLVIDYNGLVQKDINEISKLVKALTVDGFFYLKVDLDPHPMFQLAEQVFDLPLDVKLAYKMDGKNGKYFGYKSVGSMVTDQNGTPDKVEFWNIPKDEIFAQHEINCPNVILNKKNCVKSYITESHAIVTSILEVISEHLGLDSQALPNLHRIRESSGDQLRLTKSTMYPISNESSIDVSLGAHTDFGSITILFNRQYGLQVMKTDKEWLFVRPIPGHAIVNLGDAMVKLSGRRLKSNIHRVVTAPRLSEVTDRYSVAYFARPENNVRMKSLVDGDHQSLSVDDDVLTAEKWIERRVKHFQTENYLNEETYAMSRGTEHYREA